MVYNWTKETGLTIFGRSSLCRVAVFGLETSSWGVVAVGRYGGHFLHPLVTSTPGSEESFALYRPHPGGWEALTFSHRSEAPPMPISHTHSGLPLLSTRE